MISPGAEPACAALVARCRFPPPGTPVTCAVSGGADSVALAVLAVGAGCDVSIGHVDHGLRPDSAADAAAVVRLGSRLGVEVVVHTCHVEQGPGLEERAREVRHSALGDGCLFGHTADDVAETVMWHLVRGAGPGGAAPMIRSRRHPLTALRRVETHELCRTLGLEVRHDPTNDDRTFTRNRIRHEVLPLLGDVAGRDVVGAILRHAELSADLSELADELAADVDPTDAAALVRQPRAVARAVVHRWLRGSAGAPGPDLATVDRVLAVAAGTWRATEIGRGRRVARTAGRLRIESSQPARLPDP